MVKHYTITIYGEVQGVSFRLWLKERARLSGITGYVQNLPDGSVYVEAEGEESQLEYFLSDCRKGPSGALVKSVDYKEGTLWRYSEFSIR